MQYISGGLAVLITIIWVRGIVALLRKPEEWDARTVVLPKFLAVLGCACCAAFLILAVVVLFVDGFGATVLVFLLLSLFAETLIVAFINCRITYDEESFTAKNFWGIKHRYSYNEITAIQGKAMDVKLYMGKRTARIDALAIGKAEFLACVNKQYRKLNNANAIPIVKSKADFIFNGNVEYPGGHIFTYALVCLLCVGAIILFLIVSIPKAAEDLHYASISFSQCSIHNHSLRLYEKDKAMYYSIPAYSELLTDADKFISLCESGANFDIGYILDEDKTPYYRLYSIIGEDGTVFLTINAINDYDRDGALAFGSIAGVFCVIWFIFVLISIYVGRHPEKFSRRFIRLFYKDEYIRIPSKKQ